MEYAQISISSKCRYLTPGRRYEFHGYTVENRYLLVRDDSNKIKPYSHRNFEKDRDGNIKFFDL